MKLTDSHCHLYYEPMLDNYEFIIQKCKEKNINRLLSIGIDIRTSKINSEISAKYNEIFATVGLHPNNLDETFNEKNYCELIENNKKIIGIGETGLDYYRIKSNKALQQENFFKHIILANKQKLPLIIHTREAEKDTYDILKKNVNIHENKIIIHCFTGSIDFAKKILDLGAIISFSGIITFKNNYNLDNIIKYVPMNKMLIETDSPYLAPEPLRGKKNTPINLDLIAKKIATIKNINIRDVAEKTTENFNKIFKIKNEK
ncbi:MAG: hydrolase TatD [Candidatus Pelagibacter sp.]|nr:hydrolase TatD [Candidatus Pelagibacter sp.]OUV98799.1 MAG: hypothetical protein CBD02_00495 [Candidatus Pelagibacter sp. TMED142]|tara:strand:+ start:618 stop:1397 length:780 start_codon:yes stop_codon:yes gene_type:complete